MPPALLASCLRSPRSHVTIHNLHLGSQVPSAGSNETIPDSVRITDASEGVHQKACVSLAKSSLAPFSAIGAVGAVRWRRWRRWRRSAPFSLTNGSRIHTTLDERIESKHARNCQLAGLFDIATAGARLPWSGLELFLSVLVTY